MDKQIDLEKLHPETVGELRFTRLQLLYAVWCAEDAVRNGHLPDTLEARLAIVDRFVELVAKKNL